MYQMGMEVQELNIVKELELVLSNIKFVVIKVLVLDMLHLSVHLQQLLALEEVIVIRAAHNLSYQRQPKYPFRLTLFFYFFKESIMKSLFFVLLLMITSTGYAQTGKWERINKIDSAGVSYLYKCISCYNERNCVAVGYMQEQYSVDDPRNGVTDMFQRTTDGGETWSKQGTSFPKIKYNDKMPYLRKIKMLDSLHAVAVGDSGRIVTTSDGGTTWIERDSKTKWGLNDVAFYDSLNGMAVGYFFTYRVTSDGGVTWQERPPFTNEALLIDVEAPAPHTYYIFDRAYTKMFRTYNDGATWDSSFIFKNNLLNSTEHIKIINSASFSDTLNGWVVGLEYSSIDRGVASPYIARTKDGGITWKIVFYLDFTKHRDTNTLIPIADIWDAYSPTSKSCITAGAVSSVLKTNDGGETWTREEFADTSIQELPQSIAVLNSTTALLTAVNGKLMRRQFPSTGATEELNEGKTNQYFWITTTPIPATSLMQVSLYGLFSVKNELLTVKVFNMLGVEVADFSSEANAGNNGAYSTFNADVGKLGGGVYILQYSAGGYTKSGPFVVAR
jgi:photosystem II stability/assembly factor-like uncharacterized protein